MQPRPATGSHRGVPGFGSLPRPMVFACAAATGFLIGFLIVFAPFAFRNRAIAAETERVAQSEAAARGEMEEAERQALRWAASANELLERRKALLQNHEQYRMQLLEIDQRMQRYNARLATAKEIEYAYDRAKNLLANGSSAIRAAGRTRAEVEASLASGKKQKEELDEARLNVDLTARTQSRVQGLVDDIGAEMAALDRELAPYKDRLIALQASRDAHAAAQTSLEAAQLTRAEAGKMLAIGAGVGALLGIVLALFAMAFLKRYASIRR